MKRLLTALLVLSLLAGCAGRQPACRVLAQPKYPDFPARPVKAEDDSSNDRDAYDTALAQYKKDLAAFRGDGLLPEEKDALRRFAAASLPLAMAEQEGKNAVYSPLSLWPALAMLAQCAQGESREQVLAALEMDSVEVLQDQVSRLWQELYTDDGKSSLVLANSIWLNSSLKGRYVQGTLHTLAQKYFAGAYAVPMGTKTAGQAITDWIGEQTRGLIGGGGPVVQTEPETTALLASSLYYRADWLSPFMDMFSLPDTFTDAAGNETTVDFMHKGDSGVFLKREGYQAAELATELGSMLFILPEEGVSPENLLREDVLLTGLEGCQELREGDIQWAVPKFDVDSKLDLNDALARLGITDLLDPDVADLSALTNVASYIYGVKQISRVKVDEYGVEAASVTYTMAVGNDMPPEDVCVMDLDRPFLFAIHVAGVPLFVGVVNQVG